MRLNHPINLQFYQRMTVEKSFQNHSQCPLRILTKRLLLVQPLLPRQRKTPIIATHSLRPTLMEAIV